jgi:hypothetical protein
MQFWHHLMNDRWIAEAVFPGLRGGYFVEAGACEGRYESAAYALEKELGWDGICVEPMESYYEQLVRTRRCQTDDRCLWNKTGESVPFTVFPGETARSGITEVNKSLVAKRNAGAAERTADKEAGTLRDLLVQRMARAPERTVYKDTVTLHDLLVAHDAPSTIHYVALDIEGAEPQVIEAFDICDGPYRVLALSLESVLCDDLMREAGYVQATNPFNERGWWYEHYFLHPEVAALRPHLVVA